MKRVCLILALTVVSTMAAHWASAQEAGAPTEETPPAEEDGPSLMERGLQLFSEGLLQEVEPTLRDLRDLAGELEPALRSFVQEMGPALEGLMADIKDWSAYHPPEMLPNGDIILRKKTPDEMAPPLQDTAPGEIDI